MLQAGTWSAALLSVGCCRPLPISPIKSDSQWLSPADDSLAGLGGRYRCSGSDKATHIAGVGAGALNVSHELAFSTSGAVLAGGGAMQSVGS